MSDHRSRPLLLCALLALGGGAFAACGAPPPPQAPVGVGSTSAAAATSAESTVALYDPEVMADLRASEAACPGAGRVWPPPACEESAGFVKPYYQSPGDQATQVKRARTLARLLLAGPELAVEKAQAYLSLQVNHCMLTGNCGAGIAARPEQSVCRDREVGTALYEAVEREVSSRSTADPRNALPTFLGMVLRCVDLEELGLLERVEAMATRYDALAFLRPEETHWLRIGLAFDRPASSPRWEMVFRELAQGKGPQPAHLDILPRMLPALANRPLPDDVAAKVCARFEALHAPPWPPATSTMASFTLRPESACWSQRDRYFELLRGQLAAKGTTVPVPPFVDTAAYCGRDAATPAQRATLFEVASRFVDAPPQGPSAQVRAEALRTMCACDGGKAVPFVKAALKSRDAELVKLVTDGPCFGLSKRKR